MPNQKVNDLTAASSLSGTELFYGLQSGSDTKITTAQIKSYTVERVALSGNATYYVNNATGNDSSDGSIGGPWKTIQYACDWISQHIDINGHVLTIQLADDLVGTYPGVVFPSFYSSTVGYGFLSGLHLPAIQIMGNLATPGNVKVGNHATTSSGAFYISAQSIGIRNIYVAGVRCVNTQGPCIGVDAQLAGTTRVVLGTWGGYSALPTLEFANCGNGQPILSGNVTDSDDQTGGCYHATILSSLFTNTPTCIYEALLFSNPKFTQMNCLISGTLTVSDATVIAIEDRAGVSLYPSTFIGTVTGKKYRIDNVATSEAVLDDSYFVNVFDDGTDKNSIPGSLPGEIVTGLVKDRTGVVSRYRYHGPFVDPLYSYQAPLTGFTISLDNLTGRLILNSSSGLAAGTINLCPSPIDGQVINIRTSQVITTLTIASTVGHTISAAPTTATAGQVIEGIYRSTDTTWYF